MERRDADAVEAGRGSVQQIEGLDDELKAIYRTVWEVPMRSLIDMDVIVTPISTSHSR